MTETTSGTRRLGFSLLTLALGMLLGWGLAEYVLWGLKLPDRLKQMPEDFFVGKHFVLEVNNSKIKYRNAPNSVKATVYPSNPRGYFEDKGIQDGRPVFSMEHTNNLHGFRGPDYPAKKPEGTRRILFLGDSYTYGQGVRLEDIAAERVCAALTAEGTPTQAINFAVNGHGTQAQVELFFEMAARFQPDFVVLAYALNDAGQDAHFFKLVDETRSRATTGWTSHSRLLGLVGTVFRMGRDSGRYIEMTRAAYLDPAKQGWPQAQSEIVRLRDECGRRNLPLVMTLWPFLYHLADDYPFADAHYAVRKFCEKEGIPLLDYWPILAGQDERMLWVHSTDQHPNEKANSLVAGPLRELIEKEWTPVGGGR